MSNEADTWDPTQYEFDATPSEHALVTTEPSGERVAVIRTSDRIAFRRCRRRWGWSSHLRGNLGPREGQSPLWMGSGFHFALEDFHSTNAYGHPADAFSAYVVATKRKDPKSLPPTYLEDADLAMGMLRYYADEWLKYRSPYQTLIWNGQPQVEVNFRVNIPFEDEQLLKSWGYDRVIYSGTLDRVVVDENGLIWIMEYKTAKQIQTLHLANDSQVTSYCWAGALLYGQPIAGVIYQQHRKDLPRRPTILQNGSFSTNKTQLITHASFRRLLLDMFGTVNKAPINYVDYLNYLAKQEDVRGDRFIRRDHVKRNDHQCQAEGVKILMEAYDMLNPNLALYPNPDRTCAFMCPFQGPCVSLDDGSDWDDELQALMKPREPVYDTWRKLLPSPGAYNPTFSEQLALAPPTDQ